ncbi:hypothetical protein LMJ53_08080 [Rheinheimera sp. UJ51]|uniref:hypothetical protein n=1 Tax=Rheinheimera sp. UJ51 TaxID=2892446 RepID=UPI001E5B24D4|nr:hypothetical protein [Rheinheimera sp. UJ51]MCC5451682.1 hypothetical protein [Rheinheimera sp. UJ51]
MNIKDLRRLLFDWGNYWAKMERPLGYSRVSITAALAESARTGIWTTAKDRGQLHMADNLKTPSWVLELDEIMNKLSPDERRAINLRYIKKAKLCKDKSKIVLSAEVHILSEL